MLSARNLGRCFLFSKCGCIPGLCTERIIQRFYVVQAQNKGPWGYIKNKLGLQKKEDSLTNKTREMDPNDMQPIEIPIHSNSTEEMWKPGYRGRTENKRF